jgi:predicted nucleic acid-binding protein
MVLVDTSVWVRFLANRAPHAAELDRLLEEDEVAGHHLIPGELLIGDAGGRQQFLRWYEAMYYLPSISHTDVVTFVRAHRLYGSGIGWVDAHLLASAVVTAVPLWTADASLAKMANRFGVAHGPSAGSDGRSA